MSVFTKAKPAGIDILIQAYQNFLYAQLNKVWGTGDTTFDSFGRVYRNQTSDGYAPEAYDGNNEYKETFFDDTKYGTSFFGVGEKQNYNGGLTIPVFIIYMVNIEKLKPSIQWRGDEEVRQDVERICHAPKLGFVFKEVETGIDTVFRDYSGWKTREGIKFRDQHPWHCFRLNFNLLYPISNC